MKKVVLTLTASLACLAAFGQGHIQFVNDSLHNVYYTGSGGKTNGEAPFTGDMPTGVTLMTDLYMGTASGALQLVSSTTFAGTPGRFGPMNVVAPFAGGTSVFVIAQVRDNGHAASATLDPLAIGSAPGAYATLLGYQWYGWSSEFTFTLGSSPIAYPLMTSASGTWQAGTVNMDTYGAGNRGAIGVSLVPEPTSFAMAGLGMAAMLIFRRRK